MSRAFFLSATLSLLMAPVGLTAKPFPETFVEPTGSLLPSFDMTAAIIKKLSLDQTAEQKSAIAEVVRNSEKYNPVVLYVLARALFVDGRKDDAALWYHSAKVRAHFDAARCPDLSARQAVIIIDSYIAGPIKRYTYRDLPNLEKIVRRAVLWDEATPHEYDRRWIDPHGIGVVDENTPKPYEWHKLAEKIREDYVRSMEHGLEKLSLLDYENRAPNEDDEYEAYPITTQPPANPGVSEVEENETTYSRIGDF